MTVPHNNPNLKMLPPDSGVKVRMYNPGFGDCFLLAFRMDGDQAFYMLVDCGVHHNYSGGSKNIQKVAADISAATDGHLDVVIVTHEHTDHLYGFKYAREVFENIEIGELWLSWAEDPDDIVAKAVKDKFGMKINALKAVVSQLKGPDPSFSRALNDVLDFELAEEFAATGGKADQLKYLKEKSQKKLISSDDYRQPGERFAIPGINGIQFFVLGPPRNLEMIKLLEMESELYFKLPELNEYTAFATAAIASAGDDLQLKENEDFFDISRPFDRKHCISYEDARRRSKYKIFFQRHYGFTRANRKAPAWRRIDHDWLYSSEQLALDINNQTNNSSLVFAIQLEKSQPPKTLLFSADAQVGNWLSWHDLSWPGEKCDDQPLKIKDLLERCVLYKVGHHGSHNATLQDKGLEMMINPDLVAMIPVDEQWANDRNWEHPDHKLYKRLEEKTRGRIIRTDRIPAEDTGLPKPEKISQEEWDKFLGNLKWDLGEDRLWIEYTVTE